MRLRLLEARLKRVVDMGLVVYLEPTPDRNQIRSLRGVTIRD